MGAEFEPLEQLLEGYFDQPFEQLPEGAIDRMPKTVRFQWDAMLPVQRRERIHQVDYEANQSKDEELEAFYFLSAFLDANSEADDFYRTRFQEAQVARAMKQAARDNELALAGRIPSGFFRLEAAVRRVTGRDEDAVFRKHHPGWKLWGRALQDRHDWEVDCFCLPDRESETGKTIYVHLGDFTEWARAKGFEVAVRKPQRQSGEKDREPESLPTVAAPDVAQGIRDPNGTSGPHVAASGSPGHSGSVTKLDDCLPCPPEREDDWWQVIKDAVLAFRRENSRCPGKTQAWAQLWEKPPKDYEVQQAKDRGEPAISMGGKRLSQSAFHKRWERYTKPSKTQ